MKRIKVIIMTLAILLSIGGAFATRPDNDCMNHAQYHKVGGAYIASGIYGYNFDCTQSSNSCSYWLNPNTGQYEQCRIGDYEFIQ